MTSAAKPPLDTAAGKGANSEGARSELQANAEKALHMKEEAGAQTHIPPHQTSHEGGVHGSQVGHTDTAIGRESTYASNLKRSHNARSGDA
jgi:hypothetical protein